MANVSVIGAGSWGLALARRLCKNGHDVTVWSHREEGVRELREQHDHFCKDVLQELIPNCRLRSH